MDKGVIDIEESAGGKSQPLLHVYMELNFCLKFYKKLMMEYVS
jgi:hypothetical protein